LFRPETVGRMAEHFLALCRAIVAKPASRIRDLDHLGEASLEQKEERATAESEISAEQVFEKVRWHEAGLDETYEKVTF